MIEVNQLNKNDFEGIKSLHSSNTISMFFKLFNSSFATYNVFLSILLSCYSRYDVSNINTFISRLVYFKKCLIIVIKNFFHK